MPQIVLQRDGDDVHDGRGVAVDSTLRGRVGARGSLAIMPVFAGGRPVAFGASFVIVLEPMRSLVIISRTPYRISLFGGGTDFPAWYREEGGAVLSTTIDKYCYISCRRLPPFFTFKHRIVWSHIESVSTISEILHPGVREGLRYLGFDDSIGLEIHHQGDLPARTGMGSSSSFAVGLIKALLALDGQLVSKREVANAAIRLEQDVLKDNVGCQDQIAAAYGGFNLIRFERNGDYSVEAIPLPTDRQEALQSHLMLFFTGASRLSSEVAADVVSNLGSKRDRLRRMRALVDEALAILASTRNLDEIGYLLHETWQLKRGLGSSVSNAFIDDVYECARKHGALGGKLLGAGGAGFMALYVPPERQAEVRSALHGCLHVPFRFEHEGSILVQYQPDDLNPTLTRIRSALPALAYAS